MANGNTIAMAPRAGTRGGSTDGTTETVFTKYSDSTKPCTVYVPESSKLDGKAFRVRAHGRISSGTTTNFTVAMYWGVTTTVVSGNKIATSAATACNNTNSNWELNAWLLWDSTSSKLQGRQEGDNNDTAIALAAVSNVISAVSPATSNSGYGITVTSTFSATSTTNVAYLDELSIESV